MNDPKNTAIDIEEQRQWLRDHKRMNILSWSDLAKRIGVAQGTISQFGGSGYNGREDELAAEVFRYRQTLIAQQEILVAAPAIPEFFKTPTSTKFLTQLAWAQRGRIVMSATGPGTGKSKSAEYYQAANANVWIATMAPSTAGVNNMQIAVLEALGHKDAVGTPQKLSKQICERVEKTGGLIILDEAQHLSEKSIDEARSWHDRTGIGLAFFGNEGVWSKMTGGSRKMAYAQLFSRVSMPHTQNLPVLGDADAMCEAWGIADAAIIKKIRDISQRPGGLRGCTMALELATMLASMESGDLRLDHVTDAWAQLTTGAAA